MLTSVTRVVVVGKEVVSITEVGDETLGRNLVVDVVVTVSMMVSLVFFVLLKDFSVDEWKSM